MFGLSNLDIQKINRVFAGYPDVKQVKIYGSRAKGNYREGSDIDLTVIGVNDYSLKLKIENDLDGLSLPYKIDFSLYSLITDSEVLDHIERFGLVFFDRKKWKN